VQGISDATDELVCAKAVVPPHPQIWPVRLCDKMKMVAHQNETQNRRVKPFRRLTGQLDKASAISLAVKYCLPPIAAATEMVNRILEFDAQRPRYLSRIATCCPTVITPKI
jgi:hypothetical protein